MFPTVEATWTGVAGESYCKGMCYLNGYLYALLWLKPARVIKIDPATMTTVDSWTGDADECGGKDVETDGTYIYVGVDDNDYWVPPAKVIKIDPETMTKVDRWVGEDYPPVYPDQTEIPRIVFDGTYLYAVEDVRVGGYYGRVTKINPGTMATAGEWNGCAADKGYWTLTLTEFDDYFYVSGASSPAVVIKVDKNTMLTVSKWEGDATGPDAGYTEGLVLGLTNDGTYIYAATLDYAEKNPLRLIRIDVATMTTIDKYMGDADEIGATSCFYESFNNHIYIGTNGWAEVPTHTIIIRVDPATMAKVDRWEDVSLDEAIGDFAVSNPKYLFASLWASPGSALEFEIPGPAPPPAKGGSSALLLFAKMLMG